MPIFDGGGGAPVALAAGRTFTRQGVIDAAHRRTKKIGEHLNANVEFLTALQEFCAEHRWYWRRRSVRFDTAPSANVYDLAEQGAADCERIIRVNWVKGPRSLTKLDPIFDHDEQELTLDDDREGPPERYFRDGDGLHITPTPNAAYSIRIPYWAVPVSLPEQQPNQIPLVPGNLHWILVLAMEKNIYRAVLGDAAKQYISALSAYQAALDKAANQIEFTDGNNREWISQERGIQSC
jgi:hypothetical protein